MSRLPFELLLALRYLRPKRTFVSIITLISVLGVTLGVAVLIIVISVMSGFDQQLREKILGFNAHLKVFQRNEFTGKERTMTNYALIMSLIASNQNVKGVAPFVMGPVVIKTEPQSGQPLIATPYVRGVDLQFETNVSTLLLNVKEGSPDLSGHGLLVGNEFAHDNNLQAGDHVSIYTPGELQKMEATYGKTNETRILPADYEVRGIFDTGFYEYNTSVVVISLENAQE